MICIEGKKIFIGRELKDALNPEKWNEFCGIIAETLALKIALRMKENAWLLKNQK